MTLEEIKTLKDLMEKFEKDYPGRRCIARNIDMLMKNECMRMDKDTYEESRRWFSSVRLYMDESKITKPRALKEYIHEKEYRIMRGDRPENVNENAMDYYLHDQYANGAVINVSQWTSIRKKCVYLLGYEDRRDVPNEKLHELNAMIIDEVRKHLEEKGVTIIEPD